MVDEARLRPLKAGARLAHSTGELLYARRLNPAGRERTLTDHRRQCNQEERHDEGSRSNRIRKRAAVHD
jgi:hypothetical protein